MALDSLEQLSTAFCQAAKPQERSQLAAKLRQRLQPSAAVGKENGGAGGSGTKTIRAAALQAFKTVQQQLAAQKLGREERDALVELGRASLASLAAPGGAAAHLTVLRYNFVRRLMGLQQYEAALEEGLLLHNQLCAEHSGGTQGSAARLLPPAGGVQVPPEAANLAVGTVLTLVLCCVEGQLLGSQALATVLQAARDLPAWLRWAPGTLSSCWPGCMACRYSAAGRRRCASYPPSF